MMKLVEMRRCSVHHDHEVLDVMPQNFISLVSLIRRQGVDLVHQIRDSWERK